jgi:hypothetical protein
MTNRTDTLSNIETVKPTLALHGFTVERAGKGYEQYFRVSRYGIRCERLYTRGDVLKLAGKLSS